MVRFINWPWLMRSLGYLPWTDLDFDFGETENSFTVRYLSDDFDN